MSYVTLCRILGLKGLYMVGFGFGVYVLQVAATLITPQFSQQAFIGCHQTTPALELPQFPQLWLRLHAVQ